MNGKVACTKTLQCADEVLIIDLGTYLDKGKYKWVNKMKDVNMHVFNDDPQFIGRWSKEKN
jgi:hypothetical protein